MAVLLTAFPVAAADIPNAGNILPELTPRAQTLPRNTPAPLETPAPLPTSSNEPNGIRVVIRQVKITGVTLFTEAQLQGLLRDLTGKEVDMAGLEEMASRLTRHYREQGYTVAHAYLPAQQITNGALEIAIVEGRYGEIRVKEPGPLRSSTLPLGSLSTGDVIADASLERTLLLLSDLPGVEARAALRPGASAGTSDLIIDIKPGKTISGGVDLDNYGARSVGRNRVTGKLFLNNSAGLGDVFSLHGASSGNKLNYGRVAWQLPVGSYGSQTGLSWSDMHYRLGGDFSALDANGSARVASVFATHPLIRSRSTNLAIQLVFDDKRLQDRIDSAGTTSGKTLHVWNLGLSGNRQDSFAGGGISAFSTTFTHGRLQLNDAAGQATDEVTARTAGDFGKLAVSAQRIQTVADATTLHLSLSGQWASKNLDSSEKFSPGGAYGVRAYPQEETQADEAKLLTVEIRYRISAQWQFTGFADHARTTINKTLWPQASGSNIRTLSGAGVGMSWAHPDGYALRAYYSHRIGAEPDSTSDNRKGRLWLETSLNL